MVICIVPTFAFSQQNCLFPLVRYLRCSLGALEPEVVEDSAAVFVHRYSISSIGNGRGGSRAALMRTTRKKEDQTRLTLLTVHDERGVVAGERYNWVKRDIGLECEQYRYCGG